MIGIQKALQRILFVTLLLSIITGLVLQGVHTVNKNKEEEKIIETQKKKDLKLSKIGRASCRERV